MELFYEFSNDGDSFPYEISEQELKGAVSKFEGGDAKLAAYSDGSIELEDIEEFFEDELTGYFESDAQKAFNDYQAAKYDIESYHGVNRRTD